MFIALLRRFKNRETFLSFSFNTYLFFSAKYSLIKFYLLHGFSKLFNLLILRLYEFSLTNILSSRIRSKRSVRQVKSDRVTTV